MPKRIVARRDCSILQLGCAIYIKNIEKYEWVLYNQRYYNHQIKKNFWIKTVKEAKRESNKLFIGLCMLTVHHSKMEKSNKFKEKRKKHGDGGSGSKFRRSSTVGDENAWGNKSRSALSKKSKSLKGKRAASAQGRPFKPKGDAPAREEPRKTAAVSTSRKQRRNSAQGKIIRKLRDQVLAIFVLLRKIFFYCMTVFIES